MYYFSFDDLICLVENTKTNSTIHCGALCHLRNLSIKLWLMIQKKLRSSNLATWKQLQSTQKQKQKSGKTKNDTLCLSNVLYFFGMFKTSFVINGTCHFFQLRKKVENTHTHLDTSIGFSVLIHMKLCNDKQIHIYIYYIDLELSFYFYCENCINS